jgi:hypothetical protein
MSEKLLSKDSGAVGKTERHAVCQEVQAGQPDQVPSKEASKICAECGKPIPAAARKCTECDTFQDWRRFLFFSSSVLSLLVALCSVLGLSIPAIIASVKDQDAKMHAAIIAHRGGFLNFEGWPKPKKSLIVDLFVTNTGNRPGMIKAIGIRFEGESVPDYNSVIFEKENEGKKVSVAWTTAIVEPGKSRVLEVSHPTDLQDDRMGKFWLRIEYLRFDLKRKTIELSSDDQTS